MQVFTMDPSGTGAAFFGAEDNDNQPGVIHRGLKSIGGFFSRGWATVKSWPATVAGWMPERKKGMSADAFKAVLADTYFELALSPTDGYEIWECSREVGRVVIRTTVDSAEEAAAAVALANTTLERMAQLTTKDLKQRAEEIARLDIKRRYSTPEAKAPEPVVPQTIEVDLGEIEENVIERLTDDPISTFQPEAVEFVEQAKKVSEQSPVIADIMAQVRGGGSAPKA